MTDYNVVKSNQISRDDMRPIVQELILAALRYGQNYAFWNVLPFFHMKENAGRFKKLDHTLIRNPETLRNALWGPRKVPSPIEFSTTEDEYFLNEYAKSVDWDDNETDTHIFKMAIPKLKIMFLVNYLLTLIEKEVATVLTDTSYYTNYETLTSTTQWDKYTSITSDPELVFKTAELTIWNAVGLPPKEVLIPYPTARHLAGHPAVKKEVYRYGPGGWKDDILMKAGLPPMLWNWKPRIVDCYYEGGQVGQAQQSNTLAFGKNVVFMSWGVENLKNAALQTYLGPAAILFRDQKKPNNRRFSIDVKDVYQYIREEFYAVDAHIRHMMIKKFSPYCSYIVKSAVSSNT